MRLVNENKLLNIPVLWRLMNENWWSLPYELRRRNISTLENRRSLLKFFSRKLRRCGNTSKIDGDIKQRLRETTVCET